MAIFNGRVQKLKRGDSLHVGNMIIVCKGPCAELYVYGPSRIRKANVINKEEMDEVINEGMRMDEKSLRGAEAQGHESCSTGGRREARSGPPG